MSAPPLTIVDEKSRSSNSKVNSLQNIFKSKKSKIALLPIIIIISVLIFFLRHLASGIPEDSLLINPYYTPNFDDPSESLDVHFYDLREYQSQPNGWQYDQRIIFCVPLRDAASHLPMFFSHMRNMTYPHNLIDLAFLVSDTSDNTMELLESSLNELQNDPNPDIHFGEIEIFQKDFGQVIGQSFSDRHGFQAQGPRRKLMAKARNWLTSVALKPYHSFVYWRDVDVETMRPTIIEDLMHHDKDVIVPNVWRPLPEWLGNQQPYDLNSWQESDGGLQLAASLDEDAVIVEGYVEFATWRPHLAYLRDPYGDPETEMILDGIGGVSILAKAKVFESGAHFPAFSFEKHAETEAFGKMCKRMGFNVVGLPHYVIWHIYEPSSDDIKHMKWMADEEVRQQKHDEVYKLYDFIFKEGFQDVGDMWTEEKPNIFKNVDSSRQNRKIHVDWSDADDFSIIAEKRAAKARAKAIAAGVDDGYEQELANRKGYYLTDDDDEEYEEFEQPQEQTQQQQNQQVQNQQEQAQQVQNLQEQQQQQDQIQQEQQLQIQPQQQQDQTQQLQQQEQQPSQEQVQQEQVQNQQIQEENLEGQGQHDL